jgi:hypothetical protein
LKITSAAASGVASLGFGMDLSNAARAPSVYGGGAPGSLRDHLDAQFRVSLKRKTPLGRF